MPATSLAATTLPASLLTATVAEPTTPANISPTPILALGTSNLYIEYILDASNSMNDALPDGTVKRTVAEKLLAEHLRAFRPETNIGLRAFGHRVGSAKAESCQDIEQVAPVEKGQVERIVSWLRDVQPQGWTPLAEAIRQAMGDFMFDPARINAVVLLSDGQETCGGDPCKLVEDLKAQGVNFTIHVIGLNVDEPTRQQLTCIAREAGGTYHDAASEQDLGHALGSVREEASRNEVIVPYDVETPTATLTLTPPQIGSLVAFFSSRGHRDEPDRMPGEKAEDIYVITPDGDGERRVAQPSNHFTHHTNLVWSPDRSRLLALESGSAAGYVIEIAGQDLVRRLRGGLLDRVLSAAWSPDGAFAALSCWDEGKGGPTSSPYELCLLGSDLDATNLKRITNNDSWDWQPAWSPDGTRIAFSSDQELENMMDIRILSLLDPSAPQIQITHGAESRDLGWSPDGRWIAFVSYPHPPDVVVWPLHIVAADGSQSPVLLGYSSNIPVWSPDSRWLAFDEMWFDGEEVKYLGVYIANADGTAPRLLAEGGGHPTWSPTGTRLAFEQDGNIWTMDADGGNQRQLTTSGFDCCPVWSP